MDEGGGEEEEEKKKEGYTCRSRRAVTSPLFQRMQEYIHVRFTNLFDGLVRNSKKFFSFIRSLFPCSGITKSL